MANHDELKQWVPAAVDHLRWLLGAEDYETAYDLIDDDAALKRVEIEKFPMMFA